MTFTISKTKLAIAITAVVMLIPATALATHVFNDVPDDKFFAAPVEWAFDNGITTGTSATTFHPERSVTRGESVTFLKRYNDNLVVPADEALQDGIDANTADIATNASDIDANTTAIDANTADIAENTEALGALPAVHWASIAADGAIIAASPGVNTDPGETGNIIGPGRYEVDFLVEDVSDCFAMVSISDLSSTAGPIATLYAAQRSDDPSSVFVATRDLTSTLVARPFTLQLSCDPAMTLGPASAAALPAPSGDQ